jgi:segregation and condensation protein B
MPRIRRPPPDKIKPTLESILFVAQDPVELSVLARSIHWKTEDVEQALQALAEECRERGVRIQREGDLVQMVTAPEAARYVESFINMDHNQRLSTAALETLAIIAYKQPVTRAGIEAVRGVNSDASVATLLARNLIQEVGRAAAPGRPVLLGVTVRFLEHFGLERREDLPPLSQDASEDEVRGS